MWMSKLKTVVTGLLLIAHLREKAGHSFRGRPDHPFLGRAARETLARHPRLGGIADGADRASWLVAGATAWASHPNPG